MEFIKDVCLNKLNVLKVLIKRLLKLLKQKFEVSFK